MLFFATIIDVAIDYIPSETSLSAAINNILDIQANELSEAHMCPLRTEQRE